MRQDGDPYESRSSLLCNRDHRPGRARAACSTSTSTSQSSASSSAPCATTAPSVDLGPGYTDPPGKFTFNGTKVVFTASGSDQVGSAATTPVVFYLGPQDKPIKVLTGFDPPRIANATKQVEITNGISKVTDLAPGDYWVTVVRSLRMAIQPCDGTVSNVKLAGS